MSALLVASLVLAAVLLSAAIVAALRSQQRAVDRVSEGTRARIYSAHFYGVQEPGRQAEKRLGQ